MPTIKIVPFPGVPGPQGPAGEVPQGYSGTFESVDGKLITVVNGIITNINQL